MVTFNKLHHKLKNNFDGSTFIKGQHFQKVKIICGTQISGGLEHPGIIILGVKTIRVPNFQEFKIFLGLNFQGINDKKG